MGKKAWPRWMTSVFDRQQIQCLIDYDNLMILLWHHLSASIHRVLEQLNRCVVPACVLQSSSIPALSSAALPIIINPYTHPRSLHQT